MVSKILPPRFCITDMTAADVDEVHRIEQDCFPTPWTRDAIRYEVGNQRALAVAARSGRSVAGYLIGWLVADEFHLGNLAVRPDFRRRGVASALLAHLYRYVTGRSCSVITLEVRQSNQAAHALYTGHGFMPVAIRPRYYHDTGENALVMLKTLTPCAPASTV